ncbi:MAG: WYL domain-containing protein [Burkholderiales bacterium]|nr:WYL domain-containing protein [Burkholderiales bacterium]
MRTSRKENSVFGGIIALEAVFTKAAALQIAECLISADQTIEEFDEDRVVMRASVQGTQELRWWLLGFGDEVEVKSPKSLRAEFRKMAINLANRYALGSRLAALACLVFSGKYRVGNTSSCFHETKPMLAMNLLFLSAGILPSALPRPDAQWSVVREGHRLKHSQAPQKQSPRNDRYFVLFIFRQ